VTRNQQYKNHNADVSMK